MRLDKQQSAFLKSLITNYLPKSDIYLFGSRTDDFKKGGDIDIIILADRELDRKEKASIEFDFFQKFGAQKLDLVSYRYDQKSTFKNVALEEAIAL